jgi:hypothetical protein
VRHHPSHRVGITGMNTTVQHVIFGTGPVGLGTLDAPTPATATPRHCATCSTDSSAAYTTACNAGDTSGRTSPSPHRANHYRQPPLDSYPHGMSCPRSACRPAPRPVTGPGDADAVEQVPRLRIRWEIREGIHEAFMSLACPIICYRRLIR